MNKISTIQCMESLYHHLVIPDIHFKIGPLLFDNRIVACLCLLLFDCNIKSESFFHEKTFIVDIINILFASQFSNLLLNVCNTCISLFIAHSFPGFLCSCFFLQRFLWHAPDAFRHQFCIILLKHVSVFPSASRERPFWFTNVMISNYSK